MSIEIQYCFDSMGWKVCVFTTSIVSDKTYGPFRRLKEAEAVKKRLASEDNKEM